MDRLQRAAIILSVIQSLRAHDSWCGETHIQKSTYLLEELFDAPLDYDFVLYKYGPYSFDLSGDLTAMRADLMLRLEARPYPYGPALFLGNTSQEVLNLYPKTVAKYAAPVEFIAERLGPMGVAELERISTALYVTREMGELADAESRARRLHELKPHVTIEDAREAVATADRYIREARSVPSPFAAAT